MRCGKLNNFGEGLNNQSSWQFLPLPAAKKDKVLGRRQMFLGKATSKGRENVCFDALFYHGDVIQT